MIVAVFGDETLFDRDYIQPHERRDRSLYGKIKLLIGLQGMADAVHRPTLRAVTKHLLQIAILPYLLLPSKSSSGLELLRTLL